MLGNDDALYAFIVVIQFTLYEKKHFLLGVDLFLASS